MLDTKLIDGKALAAQLRAGIAARTAALKAERGIVPGLCTVLVGDDPASQIYVRSKAKASIEAGFVLRGGFGVSVFATGPMTTPNIGTGVLAPYGDLGDETNAFFAVTAHYHVPVSSWLTPYFGLGLGYMQSLGTHDAVITNFRVKSAPGFVLQAGADMRLGDNVGVFADVKRYFLSTTATGNLGPDAAVAHARVDPWIVSTGLTFTY